MTQPKSGCIGLPLRASMYVRRQDLRVMENCGRAPWAFRTKLDMAAEGFTTVESIGHMELINDDRFGSRVCSGGERASTGGVVRLVSRVQFLMTFGVFRIAQASVQRRQVVVSIDILRIKFQRSFKDSNRFFQSSVSFGIPLVASNLKRSVKDRTSQQIVDDVVATEIKSATTHFG